MAQAKRKHRVALFEVIHKDRRFADPSTLRPHTPSWFFKSRHAGPDLAAAPIVARMPNRSGSVSPRNNPDASALLGVPPSPVDLGTPATETLATELSEASFDDTAGGTEQCTGGVAIYSQPALHADANDSWPVTTSRHFAPLDSHTRKTDSSLTPTSLAIIAASLVVVLGAGFALTRSPQGAQARNLSATYRTTPEPQVLDVKPIITEVPPAPAKVPSTANSNLRQPGKQYLVIHVYEGLTSAEASAKYFEQHGVHCTVEQKIKGIDPHLYALVGWSGFDRSSAADYSAYAQRVNTILTSAPSRIASKSAFKPRLILWE